VESREVRVDVRSEDDVERAVSTVVKHEGGLDALVLCHGGGHFVPLTELEPAFLMADLKDHALGTLTCLRAAARVMEQGQVIVIGSIAAGQVLEDCGGYSAAKAAQRLLVLSAAEELRPQGIRVCLVHPGAVDTPIWDGRAGFDRAKMLHPDDVARTVEHVLDMPDRAHVTEITIVPRAGTLDAGE